MAAWAAATAGLGSFVGWCIWTVLDMPSRVHAEAAEDYAKGMVRTELDLHALRALAFVVPLGALAVASAWACWPIAKHSLHGKTHVSWHRLRRHPLRAGFALVALACIVAMPVVASQDPPTHGAAEATGDGVLVPDWPPWYDSGFWTVRISAVPGAVYRYLATTCPTSRACMAWGQTPDMKSIFTVSTDGGATWREAGTSGAFPVIGNISCWDSMHCLVSGQPPEITADGGRRWATVGPGRGSSLAVICPGARSCLLLSSLDMSSSRGRVPILVTHDGGARWVAAGLPPGTWSLFAASCPSAEECFVVGHRGEDEATTGAILSTNDGGRRWAQLSVPGQMPIVTAIACSSPKRCVVAGHIGKADAQGAIVPGYVRLFATMDGGQTWEPVTGLAPLGNFLGQSDLACTPSSCIGLFGNGPPWKTFVSLDAGLDWAPDSLASAIGRSNVGGYLGGSLSCNRTGLCTLVGDQSPNGGGFVLYSSDGGVSWSRGRAANST